jgi:hypothetical protein
MVDLSSFPMPRGRGNRSPATDGRRAQRRAAEPLPVGWFSRSSQRCPRVPGTAS